MLDVELTGLQYTPATFEPAIEWRDHIDDLLSDCGNLSIFGDGTQDMSQSKRIKGANQELKRLPHIDTYAYRPHITIAYMPVGLGQVFIKEVGNWGLGMLGYGTDINYGD